MEIKKREKKSIYGCLEPQRIRNKYTKEYHWVNCTKCAHCRSVRSSELSGRIEREMLNPANKSCYLLTLTYDNEHLPTYELIDEDLAPGESPYFISDRERFPIIKTLDHGIKDYYCPVNATAEGRKTFGHLDVEDCQLFLHKYRAFLVFDYKREIIPNYERFKFRYFLCGEYGPVTFRPHYHLLLWFKERFTGDEERYILEIIRKSWKNGSVDFQAVTDRGVKNYLSSYVTGSSSLPKVLQLKPCRPFCTFSKKPIIGYYEVDNEEIQKILDTGVIERYKWNDKEKCFIDDAVSPTFFRRYFPKCQDFNNPDGARQLRVYSYVYNYFKDIGKTHTIEELKNIQLQDIPFPVKMNSRGRYYEEWSYTDKYASLVAYRYCLLYGYTPEYVFRAFTRLYSRRKLSALGSFYEYQEKLKTTQYPL